MKKYTASIYVLSAALLLSCGTTEQSSEEASSPAESAVESSDPSGQAFLEDEMSKNILQIAIGSADHTTLVAGVQAAELENVLANNGPLTVFAPVNSAFDALPEGTLADLLKPENKATLAKIITGHASPGTVTGKALKDGMKLFMATGYYLDVRREGEDVFVGGAKILGTVPASNGVVHVVDKVMLPPS